MVAERVWRRRGRLADDLASLHDLLPAGLFGLDRYAEFLDGFYAREGLARRFADLRRELYVVANDVDATERVVFGEGPLREAMAAGLGIPGDPGSSPVDSGVGGNRNM